MTGSVLGVVAVLTRFMLTPGRVAELLAGKGFWPFTLRLERAGGVRCGV